QLVAGGPLRLRPGGRGHRRLVRPEERGLEHHLRAGRRRRHLADPRGVRRPLAGAGRAPTPRLTRATRSPPPPTTAGTPPPRPRAARLPPRGARLGGDPSCPREREGYPASSTGSPLRRLWQDREVCATIAVTREVSATLVGARPACSA